MYVYVDMMYVCVCVYCVCRMYVLSLVLPFCRCIVFYSYRRSLQLLDLSERSLRHFGGSFDLFL